MAVDDPLDRGEPDADSLELLGPVQPLERREKAASVVHIETGAVVANKIDGLSFLLDGAELYLGVIPPRRVLPGIAQEIFYYGAQKPPVAGDRDPSAMRMVTPVRSG